MTGPGDAGTGWKLWVRAWALRLALLAGLLMVPAIVRDAYLLGVLVFAGIYCLLALSLDLLLGIAGQISFGHAALFGLGAYVSSLLVSSRVLSYWVALPLTLVLVGLFGLGLGLLSLRLRGVYFAIATLAVAEILRLINLNWVDLTRGAYGLSVPKPFIPFTDIRMLDKGHYFIFAWLAVLLVLWILRRLLEAPLGRAMKAVRESELLAASIGIDPLRTKVTAFVLSSMIAALAGAIYAPYYGVITPALMSPHYSATGLLMVIVGGRGTLYGAIVGALIFTGLPELFRGADDLQMVIFSVVLMLSVLFLPGGLWRFIRTAVGKRKWSPMPIGGRLPVGRMPREREP